MHDQEGPRPSTGTRTGSRLAPARNASCLSALAAFGHGAEVVFNETPSILSGDSEDYITIGVNMIGEMCAWIFMVCITFYELLQDYSALCDHASYARVSLSCVHATMHMYTG